MSIKVLRKRHNNQEIIFTVTLNISVRHFSTDLIMIMFRFHYRFIENSKKIHTKFVIYQQDILSFSLIHATSHSKDGWYILV